MSFFLVIPVGFCFSFLDVMGKIAQEAGLLDSDLAMTFGLCNAVGRFLFSFLLDFTRGHALGGVHTYMVVTMIIFISGMLCLVLPPAPGALSVQAANVIVGFSYGGMMALVPLGVRDFFGTKSIGIIYGILYMWVYLSIFFWASFSAKPVGCVGVACYRTYCLGGLVSTLVCLALTVLLQVASLCRSSRTASAASFAEPIGPYIRTVTPPTLAGF